MKNKKPYRKKSRIGIVKSREIIRYFSMDFPAVKTKELTGLNPKTIDDWYRYIREIIFLESEQEKKEKCGLGVYKLDESYFLLFKETPCEEKCRQVFTRSLAFFENAGMNCALFLN